MALSMRVAQLLEQVAAADREKLPPGATDLDLKDLSEQVGFTIPGQLADWLKMSNGPRVGPGMFFGIGSQLKERDIGRVLGRWPHWRERKWLPITSDGCGNYYVMLTGGEFGEGCPIVFVDTIGSPENPAYIVASDLSHLLVFLLEEELGAQGWPFNERYVMERDPAILNFHGVPRPWGT